MAKCNVLRDYSNSSRFSRRKRKKKKKKEKEGTKEGLQSLPNSLACGNFLNSFRHG